MSSDGASPLKVRREGDVGFVSITDVRDHTAKLFDEVLEDFRCVVVQRRGTPVGVMVHPERMLKGIQSRSFTPR